jgi:hypothetical protein
MQSQLMKGHIGQQLLDFAKSSVLTPAQLLGEEEIAPHKGANKLEYVPRRELGRDCSSIFQRGCMNCTSGTCSKLLVGWSCSTFALRTIIISVDIRSSLFPWRNSGSYSIWMQLMSNSSIVGLCKCLLYYKLKINALDTLSHI